MKGLLEIRQNSVSPSPEVKDFPLEIRADSITDDGHFKGYASVFDGPPDSYGDIVAKGAFYNSLKEGGRNGNGIAMLWHHAPEFPIGNWASMEEDEHGLSVEGDVDKGAAPLGIPVYSMIKRGAVRGMSIGFRTVKSDKDDTTGIRTLQEIELWETSLVTFPANKRATVTSVKEIESAKTPRELERALREAGLSNTASKYMVSMCRSRLAQRDAVLKEDDSLALLAELRRANLSLELFKSINL